MNPTTIHSATPPVPGSATVPPAVFGVPPKTSATLKNKRAQPSAPTLMPPVIGPWLCPRVSAARTALIALLVAVSAFANALKAAQPWVSATVTLPGIYTWYDSPCPAFLYHDPGTTINVGPCPFVMGSYGTGAFWTGGTNCDQTPGTYTGSLQFVSNQVYVIVVGSTNTIMACYFYPLEPGTIHLSAQETADCPPCYDPSEMTAMAIAVVNFGWDASCDTSSSGWGPPFPPPGDGGSSGGGGCSQCQGCGGTAAFASGTAANSTVNNNLDFRLNLGDGDPTQKAGFIWLKANAPSSTLATPAALMLPYQRTVVGVVTNSTTGYLQQVMVPQGVVNLTNLSAYEYQLQCFPAANITGTNGTTHLATLTGSPVETWDIKNPNGSTNSNALYITDIKSGMANQTNIYTFAATNSGCALVQPDGVTTVTTWRAANATNSAITNFYTQTSSSNQVLRATTYAYQYFSGITNKMPIQKIEGSGSVTQTTTYTYQTPLPTNSNAALLQRIDYPNGNWVYYVCDGLARKTTEYTAYGTNPPPAAGSVPNPLTDHCQETDYYYSLTYATDGINDPGDTNNPWMPTKTVVSLPVYNGSSWTLQEVSRTYQTRNSIKGTTTIQRCPNPGALWNDPANLISIKQLYGQYDGDTDGPGFASSDPRNGMTHFESHEDGTCSLYDYSTNVTGIITTNSTGQPDNWGYPTLIINGTRTITVQDSLGRIVSRTVSAIANYAVTTTLSEDTYTYSTSDLYGQNYFSTDLAGRTNFVNYDCCGLDSTTDPDGVLTSYTYDQLRRQIAVTTSRGSTNLTITNILDGAGRTLVQQRIGSDNSVITLSQSQYDVLGRVVSQTNALNGVTTTAYGSTSNPLCMTNVNPDGGTQIQFYNYDGTSQSVSGTAVAPMQYQYGVEPDGSGGPYRQYTLAVKLTSSGGTNEWTKTYTDGVGRQYKTIYATNSGTPPFSVSYFNGLGEVTNVIDPDGVSTLYAYSAKGERQYTAIDMNRNTNIDFNGTDRITYVTNDTVFDSGVGYYVQRSQTYVWSTNGNASSNLISTVETSTNGLITWNIVWNSVAVNTGLTNRQWTHYGTGGYRYVTNTAPDGSYTLSVYQYGQPASTTSYNSTGSQISGTIYGFDSHGRKDIVTDARNGTTTYTFNNADRINSTTTPSPSSGVSAEVTSNYFDTTGRATGSTLPDGATVTNLYFPTGHLKQTFGSRTYPVGYGYDAQNRMTTTTNWTNFASNTGARVTTWAFDAYRGLLSSKTYNGGTVGASYTYTGAERPASRLWARGTNTTYTYNYAGDLATVNYNDGATPSLGYGYDRRGRQIFITNGTAVTTLTFNDQNQPLIEFCSGGPLSGASVTNGYDSLLRRTVLAAIDSATLAKTLYGYDAASRLSSVSDGTNSATYSYLANSPLVSQIVFTNVNSLRMTTTKSYDYLNRLTSISSANASSVILDSHGYTYDSADERKSVTNADGTYWLYGHDTLGQVTSGIKYWPDGTVVAGQQSGYNFDNIGNRTTSSAGGDQFGANLRYENYTANNLNQYTARTVPGAADIIGVATNTANVTVNNQPTYRKGNYFRAQLPFNNASGAVFQSVTNLAVLYEGTNSDILTNINGNFLLPPSNQTFSYDADGNMTGDSLWTYGWDAENRLISMTNVSTIPITAQRRLDFEYDYLGRRVRKIVSTNSGTDWIPISTNLFIYAGKSLMAEINGQSGAVIHNYYWGSDLSGTREMAGGVGGLIELGSGTNGVDFTTYDGNGNISTLVGAGNGLVAAQYEYSPFGEVIRISGSIASGNPIRFSTKYLDNETDLIYYGSRYYCSGTGRWLSIDPIEESGGDNLYSFAYNKPIDYIDYGGDFSITFNTAMGKGLTGCGGYDVYWHFGFGNLTETEVAVTHVSVIALYFGCDGKPTPYDPMDNMEWWEAGFANPGINVGVDDQDMWTGKPGTIGLLRSCVGEVRVYSNAGVMNAVNRWHYGAPYAPEMLTTETKPLFWVAPRDVIPVLGNAARSSTVLGWACCQCGNSKGIYMHFP